MVVSAKACTANFTVGDLTKWCGLYGPPRTWVSDNAAHFKKPILRKAAMALGIHHHFSVAESAWNNGMADRVMQKLVRTIRAMLWSGKAAERTDIGVTRGAVGAEHILKTEYPHHAMYANGWKGISNRVCGNGR